MRQHRFLSQCILLMGLMLSVSVLHAQTWNHPHGVASDDEMIAYGTFSAPPKTLDPARAYSSNEVFFLSQIYEPPLQYHYLKRPYELIPGTSTALPQVTYEDWFHRPIKKPFPPWLVGYSVYDLTIKPHILYQPHPAFAKTHAGKRRYRHLSSKQLRGIGSLDDFKYTGTRALTAGDYVYGLKRLASPKVHSPIFGVLSEHIVGFKDYASQLSEAWHQQGRKGYLDLRAYNFLGVGVESGSSFRIRLYGEYPQFPYWLAMTFFSPIPWEVDQLYAEPGLAAKQIGWNWSPVGTGPYQMVENNPNKEIVLAKNPNFHEEKYPADGTAEDRAAGYLTDAGKRVPFIDRFIFQLEKESIPRWNKFLQGYYDLSGISSDSFDQAIRLDEAGRPHLTPAMKKLHLNLQTTSMPSTYYVGFNMMDPVVGGYSKAKRSLRQAISIVLNDEEFISIFLNGRGVVAQGPLPPGLFGYQSGREGMNPYIYEWRDGQAQRRSVADAKRLLVEAGYPGGINPKTGRPLVINYDVPSSGGIDDRARLNWMREQLDELGIALHVHSVQYNRFQDKVRHGQVQLFTWGWNADYPDPENFLFLLNGSNGKVLYGGENASNYDSPAYNALFQKMQLLPNGPARQDVINKMVELVRRDAPWAWGYHPVLFFLTHDWLSPLKPHAMSYNYLKYLRLDSARRARERALWNAPVVWPLMLLLGCIGCLVGLACWGYWYRYQRGTVKRYKDE